MTAPDGGPPRPFHPPAARPTRRSTLMEVLDEFDTEFPQSVTFCQLISVEDFERQAATYTERALRRLFRTLDRNPALAERVVRKGKQAECEQRGLLSFLWVRAAGRTAGEWDGDHKGRCCHYPGQPSSAELWAWGLGMSLAGFAGLGLPEAPGIPAWGVQQAGISQVQLPSSSPIPPAVAGEVLLCSPGRAELLQQCGCPGDAPAPGAPEEEHLPRAPLLPR